MEITKRTDLTFSPELVSALNLTLVEIYQKDYIDDGLNFQIAGVTHQLHSFIRRNDYDVIVAVTAEVPTADEYKIPVSDEVFCDLAAKIIKIYAAMNK